MKKKSISFSIPFIFLILIMLPTLSRAENVIDIPDDNFESDTMMVFDNQNPVAGQWYTVFWNNLSENVGTIGAANSSYSTEYGGTLHLLVTASVEPATTTKVSVCDNGVAIYNYSQTGIYNDNHYITVMRNFRLEEGSHNITVHLWIESASPTVYQRTSIVFTRLEESELEECTSEEEIAAIVQDRTVYFLFPAIFIVLFSGLIIVSAIKLRYKTGVND